MEILARVTGDGVALVLTAAGWGPESGRVASMAEALALADMVAAWDERAGYLPREAQVREAADAARLTVASVTAEPPRLMDVLY